jgi:hypothetical protein
MNAIFVYKNNKQDPCLQSLKRWLKRLLPVVFYFQFTPQERGRFECQSINERLNLLLNSRKYEILIDWDGHLNIEEIKLLRSKNIIYLRYLSGFTSLSSGHTTDQAKLLDLLRLTDFYMVSEGTHIDILRREGVNAIKSPFFADPILYRPIGLGSKLFDFFFVGAVNSHWASNRKFFLEHLSQNNRTLIVSNLTDRVRNALSLPKIEYEYIVNFLQNNSAILCGSDLLPSTEPYNQRMTNMLYPYELEFTIRARTFSSMASRRAYLVEKHNEIEQLFEPNREILTWSSYDELDEIAGRYLRDEKKLNSIAHMGYRACLSKHTIFHRLATIEQLIGKRIFNNLNEYISSL